MKNNMISYDYIQKHTIWVVKFDNGEFAYCTYEEILKFKDRFKIIDIDRASWRDQPVDLQIFYRDYEEFNQNTHTVYDFYKDWILDTNRYKSSEKSFIEVLNSLHNNEIITVLMHNRDVIGTYEVNIFKKVLKYINLDFHVIKTYDKYGYKVIIIYLSEAQKELVMKTINIFKEK